MATVSDTFERKEKKYLITAEQCRAIKEALALRMELDDYGASRIDSLYLDTPDRSLICRSLEKPVYKEKLRIRSYGAFSEAGKVFVEIKKKFKGIVYKRRVAMSAAGAQAFYSGELSYEEACERFPIAGSAPSTALSPGKVQIAREIEAFLNRYDGLAPSMLISCMREAWRPIDPEDEDCVDRITFDEDICYVDLMQDSAVQRCRVTGPDQVVMEVKCAGGYPAWLCELFSEVGAYPRSFSKYGNAYKRVLAGQGAIGIRDSDSGKVSIHRIPTARERVGKHSGALISPSAGYELATPLTFARAS